MATPNATSTSEFVQAALTGKRAATQAALIDSEDFIRDIVRDVLQQFLEAEMTAYLGAGPYERSEKRTGMRNGYKPRMLKLKVGTITLSVPQERDGSFSTELLEVAVLLGHEFASANESPCLNLVASYPFHDYAAFGKPSAYQSAGTS